MRHDSEKVRVLPIPPCAGESAILTLMYDKDLADKIEWKHNMKQVDSFIIETCRHRLDEDYNYVPCMGFTYGIGEFCGNLNTSLAESSQAEIPHEQIEIYLLLKKIKTEKGYFVGIMKRNEKDIFLVEIKEALTKLDDVLGDLMNGCLHDQFPELGKHLKKEGLHNLCSLITALKEPVYK